MESTYYYEKNLINLAHWTRKLFVAGGWEKGLKKHYATGIYWGFPPFENWLQDQYIWVN